MTRTRLDRSNGPPGGAGGGSRRAGGVRGRREPGPPADAAASAPRSARERKALRPIAVVEVGRQCPWKTPGGTHDRSPPIAPPARPVDGGNLPFAQAPGVLSAEEFPDTAHRRSPRRQRGAALVMRACQPGEPSAAARRPPRPRGARDGIEPLCAIGWNRHSRSRSFALAAHGGASRRSGSPRSCGSPCSTAQPARAGRPRPARRGGSPPRGRCRPRSAGVARPVPDSTRAFRARLRSVRGEYGGQWTACRAAATPRRGLGDRCIALPATRVPDPLAPFPDRPAFLHGPEHALAACTSRTDRGCLVHESPPPERPGSTGSACARRGCAVGTTGQETSRATGCRSPGSARRSPSPARDPRCGQPRGPGRVRNRL